MNGYLLCIVTFLVGIATAAAGELLSEEIRDRLDQVPHAILRLAARKLGPTQRATVYHDEWLPELAYILKGAETRPITRLIVGTRYSLGILVNTRRITPHLHRPAPGQPQYAAADLPEAENNLRSFSAGRQKFLISLSAVSLGAPIGIGMLHPMLGEFIAAVEIVAVLIIMATALFGSQALSHCAFRLLRWFGNRPEPPTPGDK